MKAYEIRIDSTNAIFGSDELFKSLPPGFRGVFVARSKEDASNLADKCIGPQISMKGSFHFDRDPPNDWLDSIDIRTDKCSTETNAVLWAERQLDPIRLDRFALFYSDKEFSGFWIEAHETNRHRIFASERDDHGFGGMPVGFKFTSAWIANSIIALF